MHYSTCSVPLRLHFMKFMAKMKSLTMFQSLFFLNFDFLENLNACDPKYCVRFTLFLTFSNIHKNLCFLNFPNNLTFFIMDNLWNPNFFFLDFFRKKLCSNCNLYQKVKNISATISWGCITIHIIKQ